MSNAYLQPLTDIAIFTGTGLVFIIIVLILSRLLSPRNKTAEKELVYESGENAEGSSWPTVSTGYFVVALLFLLFEIEIIFLVPVAIHLGSAPGTLEILIAIIIFVLILAFGLAYAWVHGYLNWFSPGKNVSDFKSSVPPGLYQDFNKRIENDRHAGRQ